MTTPYDEHNIAARVIEIAEKCRYSGWFVEAGTIEALLFYQDFKIVPGSFLFGILTNDLKKAVSHADSVNRYRIADILCCIYNFFPSAMHGSKEKVHDWTNPSEEKKS